MQQQHRFLEIVPTGPRFGGRDRDSDSLRVGMGLAIGNPLGLDHTVTLESSSPGAYRLAASSMSSCRRFRINPGTPGSAAMLRKIVCINTLVLERIAS